MSLLDIHQLEIFAKVTELRSFSKAAKEMYLSQPTISQHIQALEKYLGTKLLDRLGREFPHQGGRNPLPLLKTDNYGACGSATGVRPLSGEKKRPPHAGGKYHPRGIHLCHHF